ncbi:MAG TPA: sialidase family protein [Terriglobia bacterium]|nr:sialidase family protein [Terriglobia bacterium]
MMTTERSKPLFIGTPCVIVLLSVVAVTSQGSRREHGPPMPRIPTVISEFVFTDAPFKECHASTLVELPDGDLLAAWFGGKREGDPSVAIWGARRRQGTWSPPEVWAREPGVPCWNPVLFRDRHDGIWLFYKYGPSPRAWHSACRTSTDGITWSTPTYLPGGLPGGLADSEILGPIKNKPILLSNGDVLAGSSVETSTSWQCWVEISGDDCRTWRKYGPIAVPGTVPGVPYGIIQPTVWETAPGKLKMLTRSTERIGAICTASSEDSGHTWTPARPTSLPNPNSGIDAVKMKDGTVALVYNHTRSGRTPLNIAFSRDDGSTWSLPYVLEDEPGEYSYPAVIQTRDGLLHITYTWRRRRIKHVVIDPHAVASRE